MLSQLKMANKHYPWKYLRWHLQVLVLGDIRAITRTSFLSICFSFLSANKQKPLVSPPLKVCRSNNALSEAAKWKLIIYTRIQLFSRSGAWLYFLPLGSNKKAEAQNANLNWQFINHIFKCNKACNFFCSPCASTAIHLFSSTLAAWQARSQ
jgi:hypothetical protein